MLKNLMLYIVLGPVYLTTFFLRINKKRIIFISYNSNKLEGNFKLVSDYLVKHYDYKLEYILMKYNNSLIGNIKYLLNCIKQVYMINTSKVIILDYNNYVVSKFKKSDVKVIQLWHASGAIKKFGNDISRAYKIKNYDYVISSSEVWKNIYSSAFNIKVENVITTGIPKCDSLFSTKEMQKYKKEMLNNYPEIIDKKVILFAPTFRGDSIYDIKYVGINLDYLKSKLSDEYIIIYRVHPSFGDIKIATSNKIINGNNISLKKIFSITDYLITDYSAITFDYSILNKPMIFYANDLEEYRDSRGIYLKYENEMPGPICKSEDEVIHMINNEDFSKYDVERFCDKHFKYKDSKSTERVCKFIDRVMNS